MDTGTQAPTAPPAPPKSAHPPRFVFVGERPSRRALQIGASWASGGLAGKTLRDALVALGLEPARHVYLNLYQGPTPDDALDYGDCMATLAALHGWRDAGCEIVGMGAVVCRALADADIPHRRLTHPAARGAIRQTARYRAHVRAVLVEAGSVAA